MTIGSILLGLALLIVVVLILARPLILHGRHKSTIAPLSTRQQLLLRKENLLNQIRALDFDHDTKKIPDDVYTAQRTELVAETAEVLKRVDTLGTEDQAIYAEIETAVAQLRQSNHQPVVSTNGKGRFCTNCGQPIDPGDNFCTSCGQDMRKQQPVLENR